MPFNATTYHPKDTPVHSLDARVKIAWVLVFSAALFFVHTWMGLALLAVLAIGAAVVARLEIVRALQQLTPVAFILLVTLVAHTFVLDVTASQNVLGNASAGVCADVPGIPLLGNFGISPAGFVQGLYYVVRIVLLVLASLVLTTSTTSTQLTDALSSMLSPLKHLGFPVQDVATIISIALRFIPVTIDQFQKVQAAQAARGAHFDIGGMRSRISAWQTVFIPLFVGLYRRADNLASAMDARAYGLASSTRLGAQRLSAAGVMALILGCVACIVVAWWF